MYADDLSGEELADVVGAACLTSDMLELLRAQTLEALRQHPYLTASPNDLANGRTLTPPGRRATKCHKSNVVRSPLDSQVGLRQDNVSER